jgi:carbamoyl-phosphate synthase small subunit
MVATHRSLFDGSLQGSYNRPHSAQDPEASPGPQDLAPMFERFIKAMESLKRSHTKTALSF